MNIHNGLGRITPLPFPQQTIDVKGLDIQNPGNTSPEAMAVLLEMLKGVGIDHIAFNSYDEVGNAVYDIFLTDGTSYQFKVPKSEPYILTEQDKQDIARIIEDVNEWVKRSELSAYVLLSQMATILEPYATSAEVSSALANYVLTSQLATILASYATTAEVATALASYVLTSDFNSAVTTLQAAIDAKGTYSKPVGGIPKTDLASAVQTSLGKADSALQSIPAGSITKVLTVTLPTTESAGGWQASGDVYVCDITVSGMSGTTDVIITPAPSSLKEWGECGVYCSAQSTDELTFTCDTIPENTLTGNILLFKVVSDDL